MDGDGDVRVSDAERERVAQRLASAQAEGRLELTEFDERVRAAYGATTRADLVPLTVDLPTEDAGRRAVEPPPDPGRERGVAHRGLAAAAGVWALVSALNVGIWAIVALAAPGPVYPWWIWVAGPWGAMLALRALAQRSGGSSPRMTPPFAPLPCGMRPRR